VARRGDCRPSCALKGGVAQREERQSTGMGAPEAGQCHTTKALPRLDFCCTEGRTAEYRDGRAGGGAKPQRYHVSKGGGTNSKCDATLVVEYI
jgi:hypothetical protein